MITQKNCKSTRVEIGESAQETGYRSPCCYFVWYLLDLLIIKSQFNGDRTSQSQIGYAELCTISKGRKKKIYGFASTLNLPTLCMMIDFRNVYIYTEQPTTCPKCSSRTDIIVDFPHTKDQTQIHKCLNSVCKETFVVQYDEDFNNGSLR